jgi:hypothetical protein
MLIDGLPVETGDSGSTLDRLVESDDDDGVEVVTLQVPSWKKA